VKKNGTAPEKKTRTEQEITKKKDFSFSLYDKSI